MSSTFFTSDTHFGHENIMKYCRRDKFMTPEEVEALNAADRGEIDQRAVRISPASVERMNDAMIDNLNAVVGENDVLYHVGDAFWGHDFDFAKAMRDRIKCRTIHHIWGNHDEPEVKTLFASSEKYVEVVVEKQKIFLCHYAMRVWDKSHKGSWCLYGHVHGKTWDEDKYGLSQSDRGYLIKQFADTLFHEFEELGIDLNPDANLASDGPYAGNLFERLGGKLAQNVADWNCNMLTLDVGVDTHDYRPWSMDELRAELFPKIEKARLRREREKASYPAGSRKAAD